MRDHVDSRDAARLTLRAIEAGIGVSILGQPLSGKSATIQRVSDLAREHGLAIKIVRGIANLKSQPFSALTAAGVGPSSGPSALRSAVADLSAPNRLIAVDDVASVDRESLGAVIEASRRSGRHPVITGVTTDELDRFDPHRPSIMISLSSATYLDSLVIVNNELGGRATPSTIRRIHGKSGGLPGLAVQIARVARLEGTIQEVDGVWTAGPRLWAPSMRGLITPFIHELSESDLCALGMLSITTPAHAATAREAIGDEPYRRLVRAGRIREFTVDSRTMFAVFPPLISEYFRSVSDADAGLDFTERTDIEVLASFAQIDWRREVDRVTAALNEHMSAAEAVRTMRTAIAAGAQLDVDALYSGLSPDPAGERAAAAIWQAFTWAVRGSVTRADRVFERARSEYPSLGGYIASAQAHVRFSLQADLCASRHETPSRHRDINDDAWAVVRAETELARGHTRHARDALCSVSDSSPYFLAYADALRCLLLLLEGNVDEAVAQSLSAIERAIAEHDLELVSMYGYTAATGLHMAGRDRELSVVLNLLLSVVVRTPSMHGGYTMGILGCAAVFASAQEHIRAAQELASQMTTIGPGPGPWPFASHLITRSVIGKTLADFEAARKEAEECLDVGRLAAGIVHESIIGLLRPDLVDIARVQHAMLDSESTLLTQLGRLAVAAAKADRTALEQVSNSLGALGAYRGALAARVAAARQSPEEDRPADLFAAVAWALDHELDLEMVKNVVPIGSVFSAREVSVMALANAGHTNREIAESLSISARTVEGHLTAIYRRIRIGSRRELPPSELFI